MLVLAGKVGERFIIGDNIVIVIVAIRSANVRLGIDCPPEIPVHREKVYKAIQEQRRRDKKEKTD